MGGCQISGRESTERFMRGAEAEWDGAVVAGCVGGWKEVEREVSRMGREIRFKSCGRAGCVRPTLFCPNFSTA